MASPKPVAQRQQRALTLRMSGLSWEQVAGEMRRPRQDGQPAEPDTYSARKAAADGKAALKAVQLLVGGTDAKDLARNLELARLDTLHMTFETIMRQAVQASDRWLALRAGDRLMRVSLHRDSLLGLSADAEAPPSPEADQTDELRERREQRLRALGGGSE